MIPLPLLAAASAAALSLTPAGSAEALGGRIVHAPGAVYAVDPEGHAWAPAAPETAVTAPAGSATIAEDPDACRDLSVSSDVPIGKDESVAALAKGTVGGVAGATVALVRGKRADDLMGYAPLRLEVWKDGKKLGSTAVRDDAYPCALVIDDLDGKKSDGNEIAVAWISLGGGYTAGVTIFSAHGG